MVVGVVLSHPLYEHAVGCPSAMKILTICILQCDPYVLSWSMFFPNVINGGTFGRA